MFKSNILQRYLEIAPAALAVERTHECEILSQKTFARPILDVGCGDGVFAEILFEEKIDTGIDYDPEEIARAGVYNIYDELITCSGADIPKPDCYYETIFSNSVLEHIPDLMPVLKEANRLLKPGGRFYITIPTDRLEKFNTLSRILGALKMNKTREKFQSFHNRFWRHYNAYPEHVWRKKFEEAGFRVVEERNYISQRMTFLYDILTPIALPAMISKRILGRWIAFPALRKLYCGIIKRVLDPITAWANREPGGCLVFYELTKD